MCLRTIARVSSLAILLLSASSRMLRDLEEIGATDHHLHNNVIEDSGSSSAPRCNPQIPLLEARHGHIPQH